VGDYCRACNRLIDKSAEEKGAAGGKSVIISDDERAFALRQYRTVMSQRATLEKRAREFQERYGFRPEDAR